MSLHVDIGVDDISPNVVAWVERLECSLAFARQMVEMGLGPSTVSVPGQDDAVPLPQTVAELEELKTTRIHDYNSTLLAEPVEDETDAPLFAAAGDGCLAVVAGCKDKLVSLSVGWADSPVAESPNSLLEPTVIG